MVLARLISVEKQGMSADIIQPVRHEEVRTTRTEWLEQQGVDSETAANFVEFLLSSSVGVQKVPVAFTPASVQSPEQLSQRLTMAW